MPVVVAGSEVDGQRVQVGEGGAQELGGVRGEPLVLVEVAGAQESVDALLDGERCDAAERVAESLAPASRALLLDARPGEHGVEVEVREEKEAQWSAEDCGLRTESSWSTEVATDDRSPPGAGLEHLIGGARIRRWGKDGSGGRVTGAPRER